MEKKKISINLATDKFQKDLIKLIQDSHLPIVNTYLIIQLTNDQIFKEYQMTLQNQIMEQQQQKDENNEKQETDFEK